MPSVLKKVNQYFTSRYTHLLQLFQKRFPVISGIISNFHLFLKLNSVSLYSREFANLYRLLELVKECESKISWEEVILFLESKSEINQEFVSYLICGRNGFFVEFGAMDGVKGSNTYLLESNLGWVGVLAEPIPQLASDCSRNRRSPCFAGAIVGKQALERVEELAKESYSPDNGERLIDFALINDEERQGLSTIYEFVNCDSHAEVRESNFGVIRVSAISLQELLIKHSAPSRINYISIDTEGSELDILSGFPFSQYTFDFVTIEHNNSPTKDQIIRLMEENGYKSTLSKFSGGESWFVQK
jgi:FkbM family methyltransferase